MFGRRRNRQRVHLYWRSILTAVQHGYVHLLCGTGSLAVVLSLWRRPHIGWAWWIFQNLPLPAAQEVRDSSNGVTPCIVMKNDGVPYHQVSSFSPNPMFVFYAYCLISVPLSCWILKAEWQKMGFNILKRNPPTFLETFWSFNAFGSLEWASRALHWESLL